MVAPIRRSLRRMRGGVSLHKANPGSAPGQLHVNPLSLPTQITLMGYSADGFVEQPCGSVEEIAPFAAQWPVVWVNVTGLADVAMIEKLGTHFGLDRLSLEDVLDTSHRSKVEFYENYVFTVMKGGVLSDQFESEQVTLFLKKDVVIVFQERPSHNFDQVRERVRRGTGRIRANGTDYLYYALIDEIIDRYFPILDRFNFMLSQMEERMMATLGSDQDIIQQIHHAKSDLLLLHRTIWPVSDLIGMLMREDTPLISKSTRNFLRDCFDHGMQANELTQYYRDTAGGLLNTFLAYEGHKTNEIVKVLTMISAVFIPLNLVAGVYGMNFHHMPELDSPAGYPLALGGMGAIAGGMMLFFYRKGWLTKKRS